MSPDLFGLIFVITVVVILLVGVIFVIAKPIKRKGMNAVTFYGATADLLTKDKKEAFEHVLDVQAEKKMKEQESGDPDKK